MPNDPINPACNQFMFFTDLKCGGPVESQVCVGAPEDEEPACCDNHPQPACPNRKGVICEIQPFCSRINNRNNDSPAQEQEKQSYLLCRNETLAHLFLSSFFVDRCTNYDLDHKGDKVKCCEDVHNFTACL